MKYQHGRFTRPPRSLSRVKLDNLALVPGNLLPQIAAFQALANQLPDGGILIVAPTRKAQRDAAISLARSIAKQGKKVRLISPHLTNTL